jgi:hypothetical protein
MRDEEWTPAEKIGLALCAIGLALLAGAAGGAIMWWWLA